MEAEQQDKKSNVENIFNEIRTQNSELNNISQVMNFPQLEDREDKSTLFGFFANKISRNPIIYPQECMGIDEGKVKIKATKKALDDDM